MLSRWAKTIKLPLVILTVFPLLSGCWDRLELEERAVVLGISIDTAEPEEVQQEGAITFHSDNVSFPKKDLISVSVQIAIPGKIQLGPSENSGSGKGGTVQSVWVVKVVGYTLDDALVNLQQQISGRLFYGHLRVIVVSEAVARRGMENINDFLRRNSEVRRMAWMLISRGRAEELMKSKPQLERVPTLYLISTMDSAVRMGRFPQNYIGMFWSNMSKKGQEAFLPYVEMKKEQNIELKGLAYFRNDKMVGATRSLEMGTYMSLKGVNPAGYRGFVQIGNPPGTVTVYATSRRASVSVRIIDNVPHFQVNVFTEINVEEKFSDTFALNNSRILEEIRKENRRQLSEAAERLIKETQRAGSDIFGFGEYLRAKRPGFWDRSVKTKERWQEMYKTVSVDVKVDSRVRRIGMKAK
jgi:spore germination protein KC